MCSFLMLLLLLLLLHSNVCLALTMLLAAGMHPPYEQCLVVQLTSGLKLPEAGARATVSLYVCCQRSASLLACS